MFAHNLGDSSRRAGAAGIVAAATAMTFCAGVMPCQEEKEEEEAWESYVDPESLCIWMWNHKTKEFHWATPREWAPYRDPNSGFRKYWWNPKTK